MQLDLGVTLSLLMADTPDALKRTVLQELQAYCQGPSRLSERLCPEVLAAGLSSAGRIPW